MIFSSFYHGFQYYCCVYLSTIPPFFLLKQFLCTSATFFFCLLFVILLGFFNINIYIYKNVQTITNFQLLQGLPLRTSEEFWKTLRIKFSLSKGFTFNLQGLGCGFLLVCFCTYRWHFTTFSVKNDHVFKQTAIRLREGEGLERLLI